MNIFQLNKILLEYNKTGKLTTIAGQGGDKAAGKNFDNIAAGITNPYKEKIKEPTEKEKQYPNLAKSIQQMKDMQLAGNKIVIGAALNDLQKLLNNSTLQTDEQGGYILPFGDDVRLLKNGNNYFISVKNFIDKHKKDNNQGDITIDPLQII